MSDPHEPIDGPAEEPVDGPGAEHGDTPSDAGAPDDPGAAEDVGSVSEEAAKLLGALSEWARDSSSLGGLGGLGDLGAVGAGIGDQLSGLADQAAATVSEINAHIATGAPECTFCPLCRTVHVVRQTSPEVKAHLAGAASSFLQALVGMLATLPPPASASRSGAGTGMEHIDLDDPEGEDS